MLRHSKKDQTHAAVIVETRHIPDIDYIIRRHMKYLNSKWQLYIFHGSNNKELFKNINAIKIESGIRQIDDYNRMLTSQNFWNNIKEEKILIFQSDSMLLRKGIESFFEWDYIGSPIRNTHHLNGGFSLRSRSVMIRTIQRHHWSGGNEDSYFSTHVPMVGGKLAPQEIAANFSCEMIFRLNTLGYHAIEKYQDPKEVHMIKNQYKKFKPLIKLI